MSLLRRPVKKTNDAEFLKEVEQHQQAWGSESYTGKPTLEQILKAKVVAFWYPSGTDADIHTTITLHSDLKDINDYIRAIVLHTKTRLPVVRLARVFVNKQERRIKEITISFEATE
jgi:hypothetical protein